MARKTDQKKAASETTVNKTQSEKAAKAVPAKAKARSKKAQPAQIIPTAEPVADESRTETHARVALPKAFSVRDENEFLPIQHLMERLNPEFVVKQAATGVHVTGGGTVLWGLVFLKSEPPSKEKVEMALREAGFDFAHNVLTQMADVRTDHSEV
jgi:hypothetical protein